jgi:hypothetical protein
VGVIKVKTEAESAYLDVKQKDVELEAQRITYKEREIEIDLMKKEKETEIDLMKKEKENELKEQEVELMEREADLEVRKRENNMKLMIEEAEVRMRCKMIEQGLPDPAVGSSVQVQGQGQGGAGQVQEQGQERTKVRRNRRSVESYDRMSLYPSSDSEDDEYDESIDNVNRCLQFLGRYDIAITKFYIPKYMEQGFTKSPLMLKYEQVLDKRIQKYKRLLDDPPPNTEKQTMTGYKQQLKVSVERERHYVQCLFLAACRHSVDPLMWRDVVGDCCIANNVQEPFDTAEWMNMDYKLFRIDVTEAKGSQLENSLGKLTAFRKLEAQLQTSTGMNIRTKMNNAKFKFSMSVVNHLCETMKIRLLPYQPSYD